MTTFNQQQLSADIKRSIRDILTDIPSFEDKIIASLAIVSIATTGQIWRLAELPQSLLESRGYGRKLIKLCEQESLLGVVFGVKLPREIKGKVVPETWYLTEKGVEKAKLIAPELAKYAVAGLPCGDKTNRLGHELLVTESLLYMMKTNHVIAYKSERFLKKELVSNRIRRHGRHLSPEEIATEMAASRGEETGDFKVKLRSLDAFSGDYKIVEVECETAVKYRGNTIRRKPAGMRWFTGSRAQADMVEANQPALEILPVILGDICDPFYLPEVAPYMGRTQHPDNYLNEAESIEEGIIYDLARLAANESLAAEHRDILVNMINKMNAHGLRNIDPFAFAKDAKKVLQMTLFNSSISFHGQPHIADHTPAPEVNQNAKGLTETNISATDDESSEAEQSSSHPAQSEFSSSQEPLPNDVSTAPDEVDFFSGEDGAAHDHAVMDEPYNLINEKEEDGAVSHLLPVETDDLQQQPSSRINQRSDAGTNNPAKENRLPGNIKADNDTRKLKLRIAVKPRPAGQHGAQKKRHSLPKLEREIRKEISLLGTTTQLSLAKILSRSRTNVSRALQNLTDRNIIEFCDVKPNPGAQKGRPYRLYYQKSDLVSQWSERIKRLLVSLMIEKIHGIKGLYKVTESTNTAEFYHSDAVDILQTVVIIANPTAPVDKIFDAYRQVEMRLDEKETAIKIAVANSAQANGICFKLPSTEIFDAQKSRWMKASGRVKWDT